MKFEVEIEMNSDLEFAFSEHISGVLAGLYDADDKEYFVAILDDVRKNKAEDWGADTKAELGLFLMFLAGFQSASGRCAEYWEAPRK